MSIRNKKIRVYEMTCTSCENRVEKEIKKLDGIIHVKVSFSSQYADIEYDDQLCNQSQIKAAILKAGYSTQSSNDYKFMGILIIVAAVVLLGFKNSGLDMESKLTNASYAVLFVVGMLTSIHCVGMCGGIMLSQSLSTESKNKFDAIKPSLLYNVGRVLSYTVLGGIIGGVGSIFSLSIVTKAGLQIFAGLFMIIMGFNMAGFSAFRKFQIKLPSLGCKVKNKSKSPFIVGILNGLMPCGPLQTMQLFALGTGSATKSALAMFVFSIGTVPLMLTFGALSGLLSKGYTKKILKFSGILIIVLGLIMGNRGFALAGININPMTALANNSSKNSDESNANVSKATLENDVQVIRMTADNNGYTPNAFYVQKGIPVKWIIDGKELNSCNNAIVARDIKVEKKLGSGENIIEFTPGDKDINFSCWMGMISGVIKVVDNLDTVDTSKSDSSLPAPSSGPSCCATPIEEGSSAGTDTPPSIYGDDITKAPTDQLITKSKNNNIKFQGIGYEFKPLIGVTGSSEKTKLTFDFSEFDNPEGNYVIVNGATGEEVTSFTGQKGIVEVEFIPGDTGAYIVSKDESPLGIIEVVDDVSTTDLESIRELYLK